MSYDDSDERYWEAERDSKIEKYSQIILKNSFNIETLYERGLLYLEKANEKLPRSNENLNFEYDLYAYIDLQNAIADFNSAIELEPSNYLFYISRGQSYILHDNFRYIFYEYKDYSNDYFVRNIVAPIYKNDNQYIKLIKDTYVYMLNYYNDNEFNYNFNFALKDYEKAIELNNECIDVYLNKANAYYDIAKRFYSIYYFNSAINNYEIFINKYDDKNNENYLCAYLYRALSYYQKYYITDDLNSLKYCINDIETIIKYKLKEENLYRLSDLFISTSFKNLDILVQGLTDMININFNEADLYVYRAILYICYCNSFEVLAYGNSDNYHGQYNQKHRKYMHFALSDMTIALELNKENKDFLRLMSYLYAQKYTGRRCGSGYIEADKKRSEEYKERADKI